MLKKCSSSTHPAGRALPQLLPKTVAVDGDGGQGAAQNVRQGPLLRASAWLVAAEVCLQRAVEQAYAVALHSQSHRCRCSPAWQACEYANEVSGL